jgi:hypothetical protein
MFLDWLASLPDAVTQMDGVTVATALQAIAVTAATIVAIRQLRLARVLRQEEARAHVVCYLEFRQDTAAFLPSIVVKNLGRTGASDILVRSKPEMSSTLYEDGNGPLTFAADGNCSLAPGQSISTLFDTMLERKADDGHQDTYEITVEYLDAFGEFHCEPSRIDLRPYRSTRSTTVHGINDIYKQLEKLTTEFKHLRSGVGGPLPVQTEARSVRLRRERLHQAQRQESRDGWRGPYPSTVAWIRYLAARMHEEVDAVLKWVKQRIHRCVTRGKV